LYLGTSFKKLLCCFDPQFIFSASKIWKKTQFCI
jgi:hypothetical protein